MSNPLDDAKRFLWLGQLSSDSPIEILERLAEFCDKYISHNALVSQNSQLRSKVAELEARVKEANERTRLVEHNLIVLEEHLQTSTGCQTPMAASKPSMRQLSPELEPDLLSNPKFVPCRDERCSRKDLHAEHQYGFNGRGPRRRRKDMTNA